MPKASSTPQGPSENARRIEDAYKCALTGWGCFRRSPRRPRLRHAMSRLARMVSAYAAQPRRSAPSGFAESPRVGWRSSVLPARAHGETKRNSRSAGTHLHSSAVRDWADNAPNVRRVRTGDASFPCFAE